MDAGHTPTIAVCQPNGLKIIVTWIWFDLHYLLKLNKNINLE